MKRIWQGGAVLCLLLFLFFGSLGKEEPKTYDGLTLANNRSTVEAVRSGLITHSSEIRISFLSRSPELSDPGGLATSLMEQAMEENGDPKGGDYLRFQTGGCTVYHSVTEETDRYRHTLRIVPVYYTYPEEEDAVDERVEEILSALPKRRSERETVAAFYRILTEEVTFDRVHKKNAHSHRKSTAYGALVLRSAVCQGYAVAMYRLCREAGIGCRVLTGTATDPVTGETERHAWNRVEVEGRWYELDATWGSTLAPEDYFLTEEGGLPGHIREEET